MHSSSRRAVTIVKNHFLYLLLLYLFAFCRQVQIYDDDNCIGYQ